MVMMLESTLVNGRWFKCAVEIKHVLCCIVRQYEQFPSLTCTMKNDNVLQKHVCSISAFKRLKPILSCITFRSASSLLCFQELEILKAVL